VKVVALHGFTGSGADFAPLADRLSVPLLALDLIGHGEAPAPKDPAAYRMSAQVEYLADQLGDNDLVVLGYSLGGRVALRLWPRLEARLRGMILISANPGIIDPVDRAERMAQDHALAGQIEEEGIEWFCRHWSQQPLIKTQAGIAEPIRAQMERRRLQNRAIGLAHTLRSAGQGAADPVWDQLEHVAVPCLVMTGALDPKYCDIGERMARQMPRGFHQTVERVGHCAHLEDIETSAAAIDRFVRGLSE